MKYAIQDTIIAQFGTIVTFECAEGYEFPDGTIENVVQCQDGVWNDTLANCQGKSFQNVTII